MAKRKRRRSKRPPAGPAQPPPESPSKRGGARWIGLVAWGALVVLALFALALVFVFPGTAGPGTGRDVELEIVGDESPEALAARLEAAGLTGHPHLLALYVRATGGTARFARGTHLLTDDLTPRELLARLERSPAAAHVKVTIPEGWTRFDIARRLQAQHVCTLRRFLEATTSPALVAELHAGGDSFEGYLFPATYELALDSDPADVVRRMKSEFDKRYASLEERNQSGLLDLTRTLGWTQREIVTLASMVEKEAVADDERPVIASVFLNRLRDPTFIATPDQPKLLQCDPTAGYGCLAEPEKAPSCASFTGKITHDVVADADNPYNTYKHEGLPPGPIANPGAKSLAAVMAPASTRFFYFVARGEGRHTFSETYAGHAAAVRDPTKPH